MKHVSVGVLKLRVPAANKLAGRNIGLAVARHLASEMPNFGAGNVKKIRVRIPATGTAAATGAGLARTIAAKIVSARKKSGAR